MSDSRFPNRSQLLKQPFHVLQIWRVEPLSESGVGRREEITRFLATHTLALKLNQTCLGQVLRQNAGMTGRNLRKLLSDHLGDATVDLAAARLALSCCASTAARS